MDESDRSKEIQLLTAAANGAYDQVVQLLNSGVSVDAEEYIQVLIKRNENYSTPLQMAAANGHDKCVHILIERGANVNAKDRFDVTALHMAAEKGNTFCIKALLDASADCCAPTKVSKVGNKAVPHLGGTTPLHLAAANNHVDCINLLIKYGANCNAVNETGHTSLHIACKYGFTECVLAQLKNDVSREILSLPSLNSSNTPLHFAVNNLMIDCVKELIHLGSDVNHINSTGYSPLHLALNPSFNISDQIELVKLIVLEGYQTDINCPDASGFTPLHYVCFSGYRNMWVKRPELAKFLIAYGANINIRNHQGFTILENELKTDGEDFTILKCIIKCMVQLPHLKKLNLYQREIDIQARERASIYSLEYMSIHEKIHYRQFENPTREMAYRHRRFVAEKESMDKVLSERNLETQSLRQRMRSMPRQQLAYGGVLEERYQLLNIDAAENRGFHNQPLILKKQILYEKLASNPGPLQHHCRCVIRTYMGPKKLKNIKNLPIPDALQHYLLLD